MTDETFQTIEAQAQESAKMLLDVGWDSKGDLYDLAIYHSDLEALEERLGRKATEDERAELQSSIRLHLGIPSR